MWGVGVSWVMSLQGGFFGSINNKSLRGTQQGASKTFINFCISLILY